ncbi:hypothetical protein IAQ61_008434 [Plenodomus lingam]|uniref:uncharacterized protein n=1 Tax=Leptosphaeria maculans TaxID=5022 RepID=UPI0033266357|nr:hypothetical protein IAQ61_008434 [Plenodomus lingam]
MTAEWASIMHLCTCSNCSRGGWLIVTDERSQSSQVHNSTSSAPDAVVPSAPHQDRRLQGRLLGNSKWAHGYKIFVLTRVDCCSCHYSMGLFIIGLPFTNTLLPIVLPTLYLWIVDTLALRRGTWVISPGTKFGVHLWDGLEIEEALFFLLTNVLIVFGQLAFDNALAVLYAFPHLFPDPSLLPSPATLIRSLLTSCAQYDEARLTGFREAVSRLKRKSRSFYLASSTFQGPLRMDLLLLYSFCRVADDLVDNAATTEEARQWIAKLHKFLDNVYRKDVVCSSVTDQVRKEFPLDTHSALLQLPCCKLSAEPLRDLLRGFEMDLEFNSTSPIQSTEDLVLYSERVAGTVAQMCIQLIFHLYPSSLTAEKRHKVVAAGNSMGVALQYVNIARDIGVDAKIGRVYLPTDWLSEVGLNCDTVLKDPKDPRIEALRGRLLDDAFSFYEEAKLAIAQLPIEAQGPIRVAVESYMEIGRTLKQDGFIVKAGRATVPKWRRVLVAWRTLN